MLTWSHTQMQLSLSFLNFSHCDQEEKEVTVVTTKKLPMEKEPIINTNEDVLFFFIL